MVKKKNSNKMTRSEVIGVRLDPKLRLAAEIAAGKERRSLSSFIEWAVEGAVKKVEVSQEYDPTTDKMENMTAQEVVDTTWDVDESDRFVSRALRFSHLLTHEEQRIWKLICEHGAFWKGEFEENGYWTWRIVSRNLLKKRVRTYWSTVIAVAKGELSEQDLPKFKQNEEDKEDESFLPNIFAPKPKPKPKTKTETEPSLDPGDIPF